MTTTDLRRPELGTGASSGEHGVPVDPGRASNGTSGQPPIAPQVRVGIRTPAVESRAAINGHPIHPMLVPLPIGALVGAALADVAYVRTHDPFWARSARHLTDAAIVGATMAAVPGAIDFASRAEIRERPEAWIHAGGNAGVLGLALVSRAARRRDERGAASGSGLVISALSTAILGITGWLGGELAYRHRIGVTES
jgi:uncharacterized membrane protein